MINEQDILNATILIVDDQPINVKLLGEILLDSGYVNFTSTNDPYAVYELYRQNSYDLILLDLLMPGMDGFQVMQGLKPLETDGYLPVLVITAQPDHKQRALYAGAKDFITKPFDLAEIKVRIHNLLEVRLLYTQSKQRSLVLEQTVQELGLAKSGLLATEAALTQEKAALKDHVLQLQQTNERLRIATDEARSLAEEIEKTKDQMTHLAHHDPLTGLPNRILLDDRLAQTIAQAHRQYKRFALLFLDLDRFKHINDLLGHNVGDNLLQSVAKRLSTVVRNSDTVCRQGGDEFVILLANIEHPENAAFSAQKLLEAL